MSAGPPPFRVPAPGGHLRAFTLLELLLAMAILAVIGILVSQAISYSSTLWRKSRDRVSALQDARMAFGRLEAALSRAVLNTRWDYADAAGNPRGYSDPNFIPTQVLRASDLHFVSGPATALVPGGTSTLTPGHAVFFQAPLGFSDNSTYRRVGGLLNAAGYFVEFGDDTSLPAFLTGLSGWNGHRYRLKEWIQPAESNTIHQATAAQPYAWFRNFLPANPGGSPSAGAAASRPLAEDVFALFLRPAAPPVDEKTMGGPVASDFRYDSRAWAGGGMSIPGNLDGIARTARMRNQLPSVVHLAAFSLERSDADRLQRLHGTTPPPELAVPADLFTDAADFDSDLLEFERRLLANNPPIRPRIPNHHPALLLAMDHRLTARSSTGRHSARGFALVLVLACLVLLLIVAVGLLGLAGTERRATKLYSGAIESQRLVDRVVDVVTSQIDTATTNGTLANPVSWTSQPGMIRTFAGTNADRIFKLYSWDQMTRAATGFASDAIPFNWAAQTAVFTDLNAPVNGVYPILDPSVAADVNGLSVTSAPGATAGQPAPMPVKWLYLLKDGSLATASASGTVSGADRADREIIARVAFWTDDETCKVNINTAAEGLHWDSPVVEGGLEREMGRYQPVRYEVQRFPGHPAGVCLSEVFPSAGLQLSNSTTGRPLLSTTMAVSANRSASIAPRVRFGGSLAAYGNTTTPLSVADPIVLGASSITGTRQIDAPDPDRLYAGMGELIFDPARNTQHAALGFSSADDAATGIARRSFVLTSHSSAPETTLFETPRISLWPLRSTANLNANPSLTNRADAYDKMMALASSLPNGGIRNSYYFTRNDSMSSNELVGIARNSELYNYLKTLTGKTAPGFSQSLETALGAANRNSLLVQAFDMIRGTVNLAEAGLIRYSLTGVRSFGYPGSVSSDWNNADSVGHVQATEHDGARGFGRVPRIVRAGIGIYCEKMELLDAAGNPITGNATATSLRYTLSPAVLVETYSPINPWGPRTQFKISARINSATGFSITANSTTHSWTANLTGQVAAIGDGSIAVTPSMDVGTAETGFTSPHQFLVRVANNTSTQKTPSGLWGSNFTVTYPAPSVGNSTVGNMTALLDLQAPPVNQTTTTWGHRLDIAAGTLDLSLLDKNGNAYSSANITFDAAPGIPVPFFGALATSTANIPDGNSTTTYRAKLISSDASTADYLFENRNKVQSNIQPGWVANDGDVVIAKEISAIGRFGGDWRLACLTSSLVDTDFAYPSGPNATDMRRQAFARGVGSPMTNPSGSTGRIFPNIDLPTPGTQQPAAWKFYRNLSTGVNGLGGAGDFSLGRSGLGAMVASPQEGGVGDTSTTPTTVANARDTGFNSWKSPDTGIGSFPSANAMELTFSPNRQVYSPIQLFGGLMRRAATPAPWETLLFSANPAGTHPGAAGQDHLFADLFWMPVVDPYPISETFSSAGKVNLNATLEPFGGYIRRETALRAALKAIGVPVIDGSLTQTVSGRSIRTYTFGWPSYWPGGGFNAATYQSTGWTKPLDLDQTLLGIRDYLAANGVFRSATQVCQVPLVPNGAAAATYAAFWSDAGRRHTPDNLREQPYAHAYARLTTRSNTFTIHHRVQVLKKAPGTPDGQWVEGRDQVISDHRGRTLIERHLDPNADYPDYATAANPLPMSRFYKWRVPASTRFSP